MLLRLGLSCSSCFLLQLTPATNPIAEGTVTTTGPEALRQDQQTPCLDPLQAQDPRPDLEPASASRVARARAAQAWPPQWPRPGGDLHLVRVTLPYSVSDFIFCLI